MANQPQNNVPPPMSKVPPQAAPPPAGGVGGLPPGGPKPPIGGGPMPMMVHGQPGPSQMGAPQHAPDEMIHLAIPRMAFEKVKENLLLLLKLMDMGGQKADADVHAQRHGMPPHPAQDPNIMALAAKLGIGGAPGGGMPPQGPPPSPMPQQPPGM